MITEFNLLSEESKVWVYPSSRKFYPHEIDEIELKIKNFVSSWKKETKDFKCSYQFLYNRFIIIAEYRSFLRSIYFFLFHER